MILAGQSEKNAEKPGVWLMPVSGIMRFIPQVAPIGGIH